MQLKRSFGTINVGNILVKSPKVQPHSEALLRGLYSYYKEKFNWKEHGYNAGALALERGETGNLHIQLYLEHDKKRFRTLSNDLDVQEYVFQRVRDAKGSWEYCTGTGSHEDKVAIDRFHFGTPKLHGDSSKADLRMMVNLIMEGVSISEIIKQHPYAWCVHRSRLMDFRRDWTAVQNGEKIEGVTMYGFDGLR